MSRNKFIRTLALLVGMVAIAWIMQSAIGDISSFADTGTKVVSTGQTANVR